MMSHQFRRHPEDMNNPRIQKIPNNENGKTFSKSPMSSNDNYTKNETNVVTSNDVENGKAYEPTTNGYVKLRKINLQVNRKCITANLLIPTNSVSSF